MNTEQEKLVMTVKEAGQRLGISRPHAYKMAREGQLPVLHLGRRLLVPKAALEKMLVEVKTTCTP
jgi:excisionase family DNA binding protein